MRKYPLPIPMGYSALLFRRVSAPAKSKQVRVQGSLFTHFLKVKLICICLGLGLLGVPCTRAQGADFLFSDAVNEIFDPGFETEFYGPEVNSDLMRNYQSGNYRSVVVELRRLLNLSLPDGRLDFYHFLLAECYLALNLPELALESYRQTLYFAPQTQFEEKSLFRVTQLHAAQGRESDMELSWKALREKFPNGNLNAGAAYLVAKAYAAQGRDAEALSASSVPQDQGPFRPSFLFLKGFLLSRENRTVEAIDTLRTLFKMGKNRALQDEAALTLGRIYTEAGILDSALSLYSEIKSSSLHFPIAQLKKAFVYLLQGKADQALALATLNAKDPDLMYESALIRMDSYYALRDTLKARRTWEELTSHARFTRIRGLIEEEKIFLQDFQWRQKRLFDAYSLQGNKNKKALNQLSDIALQGEKLSASLQLLQNELNRFPEFLGDWKLEGTLEKKYLEYIEGQWVSLEKKIKESQDSPAKGMGSDGQLDALLEKRRDLFRLRSDIYELMARLQKKNADISQVQAKYIDVGLMIYGRLKKSLYTSSQQERELSQALQNLEKEVTLP